MRSTVILISSLFSIMIAVAPAHAKKTRHCQAYFQLEFRTPTSLEGTKVKLGGSSSSQRAYEFSFPGTATTANGARRKASANAQRCMGAHYAQRNTGARPAECGDAVGYVLENFRIGVARAACFRGVGDAGGSGIRHVVIVAHTYGDKGCGATGLKRSLTVGVSQTWRVDCPHYAERLNKPWRATRQLNTDRPGADLPGMPRNNISVYSDCQNLCQQTTNCRAWTWVRDRRQCWLKGSIPIRQAISRMQSGTKAR
jgi:hypothetical protein